MRYILLLPLIFIVSSVRTQSWVPVGARSMSLANASVSLPDVWAYHHNPGALGQVKEMAFSMSYESRFMLKDLQSQGVVGAIPLRKGVISVGGQFFGHQLYRSTRAGLGYSLLLHEKLSVGVQMNYLQLSLRDYGNKSGVSAEAGILARVNENVQVGFSIFNLTRSKLNAYQDERFQTLMRLGLSWKVSGKLLLLAEAEKEVSHQIRPKGALEYQIHRDFCLRFGAAGNPIELTFGFGCQLRKWIRFDFGAGWHQQLGWSPHVGFTFHKKKETQPQ